MRSEERACSPGYALQRLAGRLRPVAWSNLHVQPAAPCIVACWLAAPFKQNKARHAADATLLQR